MLRKLFLRHRLQNWFTAFVVTTNLCLALGCNRDTAINQVTGTPSAAQTKPFESQLDQSLKSGNLEDARQLLRQAIAQNPNDFSFIERLGDLAVSSNSFAEASELYREASRLQTPPPVNLYLKWHQSSLKGGLPYESIIALQSLLKDYPELQESHFDLAGLATAMGLPRLSLPSLRWLVMHGQADMDSLMILIDPDHAEPDLETCQELLSRFPAHTNLQFPLALDHVHHGRWNEAKEVLSEILASEPEFAPAYLLNGRVLVAQGQLEGLKSWLAEAPGSIKEQRPFWELAADLERMQGFYTESAKSYLKALQIESWESPSLLQGLYMSLQSSGRSSDAQKVQERLELATQAKEALQGFLERKSQSKADAMRIAEPLAKMGRLWEAVYWLKLAQGLSNQHEPGLATKFTEYRTQLANESSWRLPGSSISEQLQIADVPNEQRALRSVAASSIPQSSTLSLSLVDEATQRGWHSECKLADDAQRIGHWIYQSLGGGVGVIDFDRDGWPDLANAVLDGQPFSQNSGPNRLFRNLEGRFVEVTHSCQYLDTQFSQGIAVGDVNEDGFADLYDCNIGVGKLYINQGDGTFLEHSLAPATGTEGWATSAALADLDGDGHCDLIETHYCAPPEPFKRVCKSAKGLLSTCSPLLFSAERDRVYRNNGTGKLVDITDEWLDVAEPGRGLGLVVGNLDATSGLDLYVANDMTLNHLWSGNINGPFKFNEQALTRGVANNAQAVSQASMGIAVDDADGDGDFDLFLSHFSDDYNTFYEQVVPGFWSDRSVALGLAEPSMSMLGFGTQFIDFNNDGWLEIFVSNGHIDDLGRSDIGYRMRPQIFSREQSGRWREYAHGQLQGYCAAEHLGRAVAIIDADRDGLSDLAVSHIYEPVSLLMNRSAAAGSVQLHLVATQGARDAVGAVVIANFGNRSLTRQLLAGNGYMASNQRMITFGMGGNESVKELEVKWPSGRRQTLSELPPGEYLVIEDESEWFELQR